MMADMTVEEKMARILILNDTLRILGESPGLSQMEAERVGKERAMSGVDIGRDGTGGVTAGHGSDLESERCPKLSSILHQFQRDEAYRIH